MLNPSTLLLAGLGGVAPAIIWLIFWLREDEHPEPRKLIFISFILGIVCVPLAIPFQWLFSKLIAHSKDLVEIKTESLFIAGALTLLWASTEEILKYCASFIGTLRAKSVDEPIDWVIYTVSTALGFAAAENALFILNPLLEGDPSKSFLTGNLRFIGADLLHVACSAIIGIFLAFSFYKSTRTKFIYRTVGILMAIALHTAFNFYIIVNEQKILIAFSFVWMVIIGIILLLERIKRLQPSTL